MSIRPLGDRVLVRQKEEEKVTTFGLVLTDTDKDKKAEGEVIAVGPGKMMDNGQRSAMDVTVGQHVIFKTWGGDKVEIGKEEFKILSQDDILGVIEK